MQIFYEKYDLHRFLPSLRYYQESKLIERLQTVQDRLVLAVGISICNETYADFLVTLKSLIRNLYFLLCRFERIGEEKIVIFLIHDGIEKVSNSFLDDAQGKIIRKKDFDRIKNRNLDQSFLGRPFTLNSKFNEDRSGTSSHANLERDFRETPLKEKSSIEDDNTSFDHVELNPDLQIPMTTHALKKWNETKSIHCFQQRTSAKMFNTMEDREELQKYCKGRVPQIKFVYAIKQTNQGKLDTHRHFFTGFCDQLHPRYCSLIDVGTTFDDHTYFGFIQMGEIRKKLGGISQEVEVMWQWSPLVMCQFIDYKLDQILKSAEGLYGLVQILPGAHQFLKWSGVRGQALDIYIKGTEDQNYEQKKDSLGIFKRNVFLTEDKLMTALLVLRDDQVHSVQYLPGARAYTDVPSTTAAILRQRRRWLNGGFSTTLYGLAIFCKQYRQSKMRKNRPCIGFMLFLQLFYHFLQIFVQTTIALGIITTYKFLYLIESTMLQGGFVPGLEGIGLFNVVFFTLIVLVFLLALFAKSRNRSITLIYQILSYALMVINVIKLAGIFFVLYESYNKQSSNQEDLLLIMAVISLYFILLNFVLLFLIKPKQFCCKCHKFILSIILYLMFQNTFFLMVKLYLICNYHDVSWGSRAINKKKAAKVERKYKMSTIAIIIVWILFNGLLIFLIQFFYQNEMFIFALGLLVFIWITVRAIQAMIYWLYYCKTFRFKLYGQFLKIKVVYEDKGSQKTVQFRNDKTTVEMSGYTKMKSPPLFVNQRRESNPGIKLQDIDIQENDKKRRNSSVSSESLFTVKKIEMDDINSADNQPESMKRRSNDSGDKRPEHERSGFWSKTSESFNQQSQSSKAKESKLKFSDSLWGKDSSIPGVQNDELLMSSSLNKRSLNQEGNLASHSSADSFWGKSSSLPEEVKDEEQNSFSSKSQISKLNFEGDRSLWGGQSSIVKSEELNPYSSSLVSSSENNDIHGGSLQNNTFWDQNSSLVSSGSERPLKSISSSNKSRKRPNLEQKERIIEDENEYNEDESQVLKSKKEGDLPKKKQKNQVQFENPSKQSSDPFKSSMVSSENKSSNKSSSFFQSKSDETNNEDSFEVMGGEISEENSNEGVGMSVISSKAKSNPFASSSGGGSSSYSS